MAWNKDIDELKRFAEAYKSYHVLALLKTEGRKSDPLYISLPFALTTDDEDSYSIGPASICNYGGTEKYYTTFDDAIHSIEPYYTVVAWLPWDDEQYARFKEQDNGNTRI